MARQTREILAAVSRNDGHADDLAKKYPWLSSAEILEMLAEAAEEYGVEERPGPRT